MPSFWRNKRAVSRRSASNKRELIRRAYYDLTGLPPSPAQSEVFQTDTSPAREEIDRPFASRRYGEVGRHWLDLVRFAGNSYERGDKPRQRYRDYIIRAQRGQT
jgi:hypothetical protein